MKASREEHHGQPLDTLGHVDALEEANLFEAPVFWP